MLQKIMVVVSALAMVLLAVALVIRAFHGGRAIGSAAWWLVWAIWSCTAGVAISAALPLVRWRLFKRHHIA